MPRGRPKGSKNKTKVVRQWVPNPSPRHKECGCFEDIEGIWHMCNDHYRPSQVGDLQVRTKLIRELRNAKKNLSEEID